MFVVLSINTGGTIPNQTIHDTVDEAEAYFVSEVAELDRFAGVYYTAASMGTEANVSAWVGIFDGGDDLRYEVEVDCIDESLPAFEYPDVVLSVRYDENEQGWQVVRDENV